MNQNSYILNLLTKLSIRAKLLITFFLVAGYVVQLHLLFPVLEFYSTMLLIVPSIVSAGLLGRKYGLSTTGIVGVITILFAFYNDLPLIEFFIRFSPGLFLTFVLVFFVGKINEMSLFFLKQIEQHEKAKVEIDKKNLELQVYSERLKTEIEEKFNTEKILKKSEEQYRNLVEKARIGVIIDDIEGNINYFNEPFLEISGYNSDELYNMKLIDLVYYEDFVYVKVKHIEHSQSGREFNRYEFRLRKKNGDLLFVEADISTLFEKGLACGSRIYIWDISDRKNTEMALVESEERFRSIYNNASLGFYRMTPTGVIVMANPFFLQLLKLDSPDEIIGKRISEILEIDEKRYEFFDLLRRHSIVKGYESEWYRKDGALFYGRETAWSIYDNSDELLFVDVILEDVTLRKQVEEEREQLISLLQSAKSEIKILSGLLPICASCKKIRDENDNWSNVEQYIDEHSEAEFSHGICPSCASKLYPGYS